MGSLDAYHLSAIFTRRRSYLNHWSSARHERTKLLGSVVSSIHVSRKTAEKAAKRQKEP